MSNNNKKAITNTGILNFAGITINTKTDLKYSKAKDPFANLENTLLTRDKQSVLKMISDYNKHSKDLDKIIYFKNLL